MAGAQSGFVARLRAFASRSLLQVVALSAVLFSSSKHAERSELDYNSSVDQWLRQVIAYLQPVPRNVAVDAAESVDKLWWDSDALTPSKEQVLRRTMNFQKVIEPWLVPVSRMPETLREACGDAPEAQNLNAPEEHSGVGFGKWITLEIVLDDELAGQAPFTTIGRTVTQSDFPRIVEEIRKQNRAEFGDRADRPD
jgi:FAD/FMN-containing dehydrogenase